MPENPYQSPVGMEPDAPRVAWLINPPAIVLLVIAIPTLLFELPLGYVTLVDIFRLVREFGIVTGGFHSLPFALGFVVIFGAHVLVVAGAIGMLRRRNYLLAYIAAIVSVIPILSPGCIAGIPIGIWALMELRSPKVRAAFAATTSA